MIASGAICSSNARSSALFLRRSGWTIGRPSERASCLTGGMWSSSLRPAGRSGWVRTSATSWPASTRAWRLGTANSGVPQKTSFMVSLPGSGLPLAVLLELLDAAENEVALEAAEPVDEENAVEVVYLVEYRAGQQFRT